MSSTPFQCLILYVLYPKISSIIICTFAYMIMQLSSENETALRLVTYIGVGLSLLALILTLVSFVILR